MSAKRTTLARRLTLILLPQFLLTLVLIVYLVVSAFIFRWLDSDLATENFFNIILFEFGTLTTIGKETCTGSSPINKNKYLNVL
uniref:Ion_trans_2 domain-containing protein n=1 Tax=Heterorhabditis bacteriophora TaxID=37862 RepID=A0A1I7WQS8_HETBA